MVPLGLSASDRAAFEGQLGLNQRIRRSVQIWDFDHNLIQDISDSFNDGQHNIDTGSDVRRSATASFFDPTHEIGLDSDQPAAGAVSPRYMLHASRSLYVDELGAWVTSPMFTGPIMKPSRVGDMLSIEAQGKEFLSQGLEQRPLVLKKGLNKVTAIRRIMGHAGEQFYRISPTTAKLTKDISLSREKSPWHVAKSIANGMGRSFFYDASGYLVCRPISDSSVYRFKTGFGGTIMSAAEIGYDPSSIKNLVYVTGGTPKGKKHPVVAHAVAPASHPLSPLHLGRGGEPGYRRYDVTDDSIKSTKAAQALANKTLKSVLLQQVTLGFDAMVVPHLEEYDVFTLDDDVSGFQVSARFSTASIPWTCAGNMSVGSMKRVSAPVRKLTRRR